MNRIAPPTTDKRPNRFLNLQEAFADPLTEVAVAVSMPIDWDPKEVAAPLNLVVLAVRLPHCDRLRDAYHQNSEARFGRTEHRAYQRRRILARLREDLPRAVELTPEGSSLATFAQAAGI